jgi:hypothetical protein
VAPITARLPEADAFKHYVEHFNAMENENVVNLIPNAQSREWLRKNVRSLTILWDRTGQKYGLRAGLTELADGRTIAHSVDLRRVTSELMK